jgi:integrase/recombinase XerD
MAGPKSQTKAKGPPKPKSKPAPILSPERPGQAVIDEFCDALWLEDGLSKNTLDAYKRDLLLFAGWLQEQRSKDLYGVVDTDLSAYFAFRHADTKASTANRRLTVLKRFYQHALRQHRVAADPCLKQRPMSTRPWVCVTELCWN